MIRRRLLLYIVAAACTLHAVPAAAQLDSFDVQRTYTTADMEYALYQIERRLSYDPNNPGLLDARFEALIYLNRQADAADALEALKAAEDADSGIVLKRQSVLSGVAGDWHSALDEFRRGSKVTTQRGDATEVDYLRRAVRISEGRAIPPATIVGPVPVLQWALEAGKRGDVDAVLRLIDVENYRDELLEIGKRVSRADIRVFVDMVLRMATVEYAKLYGYEFEVLSQSSDEAFVNVHLLAHIEPFPQALEKLVEELSDAAQQELGDRTPVQIRPVIESQMREQLRAAGGLPFDRYLTVQVQMNRGDDGWRIRNAWFDGRSLRELALGGVQAVPLIKPRKGEHRLMVIMGAVGGVVALIIVVAGFAAYFRRRKSLGQLLKEPAPLPKAKIRKP